MQVPRSGLGKGPTVATDASGLPAYVYAYDTYDTIYDRSPCVYSSLYSPKLEFFSKFRLRVEAGCCTAYDRALL